VRGRLDRLVPLPVRAAALMPAASLTVHQLRFQLAFGAGADGKLASEGHQYLGAVTMLAAMLVAIAAGVFLAALARAWRGAPGRPARSAARGSFGRIALVAAASLLAIYCAQESIEGILFSGHPGGVAGVFGAGGLLAVPLSVALGLLVAACLRVAEAAVRWVTERERPASPRRPARRPARPADAFLSPLQPLARAAAGRAPPRSLALTS
jgi:hypothetical protein